MPGIQKYSEPFCINDYENTMPNRINVVIYLKSIFFLEKFVNADIEISENKKPIRNFRSGCSKAFYVQITQNTKRQLKHKREAKRAFDNSREIWENPYH